MTLCKQYSCSSVPWRTLNMCCLLCCTITAFCIYGISEYVLDTMCAGSLTSFLKALLELMAGCPCTSSLLISSVTINRLALGSSCMSSTSTFHHRRLLKVRHVWLSLPRQSESGQTFLCSSYCASQFAAEAFTVHMFCAPAPFAQNSGKHEAAMYVCVLVEA